ncbi:helicase-like protein [Streptomyces sp. 846.5]|nr:helicase-like protein [Streptomyces sp. 846.5]
MACGTGKTMVAARAAVRLVGVGGAVLVLVPSLSLLAQTARSWQRDAGVPLAVLGVCSDDADERGPDSGLRVADLGLEVSTGPVRIAGFLRATVPGVLRVLFGTYHSVRRIAEAYADGAASGRSLAPLDLVVFDEAHRMAGDLGAPFATGLHDAAVPARRRLFLTATPRVSTEAAGEVGQSGMEDSAVFGRRLFTLPFAAAIGAGLLSDYQVVVVGVSDRDAHQLVLDNPDLALGGARLSAVAAAGQIALAQAARAFDLRRVLVFHNRVHRSKSFRATLPAVVEVLPPDLRPAGALDCRHVDGSLPGWLRAEALRALRATGEGAVHDAGVGAGGWTVVSNVRVLAEGVDCPEIDAVCFAEPRTSQIDVVQAVGRALRRHPERTAPAVIVLPVYLAPGESEQGVLEDSAYRHVWQTIRALRDHDERLDAALRRARLLWAGSGEAPARLPEQITALLPAGAGEAFLRAFRTRAVTAGGDSFAYGLEQVRAFAAREGHALVPAGLVDATGFRLGAWVGRCRTDHRLRALPPQRVAALSAVPGWQWDPNQARWQAATAALGAFAAAHGHLRVPRTYTAPCGYRLGAWVRQVRVDHRRGRLPADRVAELDALAGWVWDENQARWQRGLDALTGFRARYGHAQVPAAHTTQGGFRLGEWCGGRRKEYLQGLLTPDKCRVLEAVDGWTWTAARGRLVRGLDLLRGYTDEHGSALVPHDLVLADPLSAEGFALGQWVGRRRREYKDGTLEPGLARLLAALPGWQWDVRAPLWERGMAELRAYAAEHGHAAPVLAHVTAGGYRLGGWVNSRRNQYRDGHLPADRAAELEALPGWVWDTAEAAWAQGYRALCAFAADHGHARPTTSYRVEGFALGSWVSTQRAGHKKGRLSTDQTAQLEALPGWQWDTLQTRWAEGFAALQQFQRDHGHARPVRAYTTPDGFPLGTWVFLRIATHQRGTIPTEHRTALDSIPGWTWDSSHPRRR